MNKSFLHIFSAILCVAALSLTVSEASAAPADGLKLRTIVIDPGHGGKDAGCVSKDRKTYEKNITLKVATLLKEKINKAYPDVKVIMTRTKDVYITLNERAEIANRNKADLFVSIHVNSVTQTSPHGYSCHILGQSSVKNRDLFSMNMELCKRENSVILLEEDYSTKYQGFDPNDPESFIFFNLMQNAHYEQSLLFAAECDISMSKGPIKHSRGISQDPFYVLWKSAMPSVLMEIGFISNPSDLAIMRSASGQDQIATALFNGFKEFKKKYDTSLQDRNAAPGESVTPLPVEVNGTVFGAQVLVSSRDLPGDDGLFKGFNCYKLKSGNLYKYILGYSDDEEKARSSFVQIKKIFPDAFFVKVEDGKAAPYKK